MSDYALEYRVVDAMHGVFDWMASYVEYDRATGSAALVTYGFDWVDAWETWWDEGEG